MNAIDSLFDGSAARVIEHAPSLSPDEEPESSIQPDDELESIIEAENQRRRSLRPVKPFDVRQPLTDKQWAKVEDYYISAVRRISLPSDPTSKDLLGLNSEIDELYTEARFDQGYLNAKYDQVKRQLSDARKTVYKQIKLLGSNDKERDALGTEWLEQNPIHGYSVSILEVHDVFNQRKEFMDSVVSVLKGKADKLIVDSAAMKLEASV